MHEPHMIEYTCDRHTYPCPDHICVYKQFSIHEHLCVPEAKPDIEDILEVNAYPFIDKCKMIDTPFGKKIIIMGRIEQKILYVADVSCQSVHFFHTVEPFCTFIELPHNSSGSSQRHPGYEYSAKAQNQRSSCYPEPQYPPLLQPRIMVEYLCAQKVGPRDISKCLILMVWFPKGEHHPHPHPCPPPPVPPSPCSSNCDSKCPHGFDCPIVKAR